MSDCSSLPTVQDFEDSLKYMDSNKEFIESQNDTLVTPEGQQKYTITGAVNKLEQEALSRARTSLPQDFVNLNFFYTFTGFNASLSSYYVYSDDASIPTQLLIPEVHYVFTDTTTQTIRLLDSYIGGKIIAKSLDPTGSGVISAGNSFNTTVELGNSVGLTTGTIAFVTGLTNSSYYISDSQSFENGDVQLSDGRVAVLQPTENGYSVTAFGDSSASNHSAMFENAAARALLEARKGTGLELFGNVWVPRNPNGGDWKVTTKTTTKAIWTIGVGSDQASPPNYPNNNMDNISNLNGRALKINGRGDGNLVVIGATDMQWIQDIDQAGRVLGTAMHTTVSDSGRPCYFAAVRTSDHVGVSEGSIGFKCYALNDRLIDPGVVYGTYFEAIQVDGAGTTMCMETNVIPGPTRKEIYPNQNIGNQAGVTFNHLVGGPVNRASYPDTSPTSCAVMYEGGTAVNPANGYFWGFESIWVVLHNSMRNSLKREVMRLPTNSKFSYYSEVGALRCSLNGSLDAGANGQYAIIVYSAASVEYSYIATTESWRPGADGVQSLGAPRSRYKNGYFVNAPSGTSDRNEKEQESKITESLHAAALEVEPLLWKWKESVSKKGKDARYHIGPIAQDVQSVFEKHGIDPFDYGFIGKDQEMKSVFSHKEIQKDPDGEEVSVDIMREIPTGKFIMNLRPIELLWLINSANKVKQDSFEERLKALESKHV